MFLMVHPGKLLDEALRAHGMTHDEAWRTAGYRDAAQFSRAITGERPLDLHKLILLPWNVFAPWWSKVVAAKAAEFGDELRADRARMLKVDLPKPQDKKGVA